MQTTPTADTEHLTSTPNPGALSSATPADTSRQPSIWDACRFAPAPMAAEPSFTPEHAALLAHLNNGGLVRRNSPYHPPTVARHDGVGAAEVFSYDGGPLKIALVENDVVADLAVWPVAEVEIISEPGARPSEDEDREDSAELDAEAAAIVAANDARIAALPFDLRLHAERLAGAMRAYPSLADGFKDALKLVFLAAQWRDRVTALWAELNPRGAANHTTGLARRREWAKTDASRIEIEQRYSRYLWRWAQRNARFLFVDNLGQPLQGALVQLIRPTSPGNYSRSQGAQDARRVSTAARRVA